MPSAFHPMAPSPFRVQKVRRETRDTFTLELQSANGAARPPFLAGQFNMLYVFGVGEVPMSITGDPGDPDTIVHTTRSVGAVTGAVCKLKRGDMVGVRGPFGTPWPVEDAAGKDVIIVAGGIGLAPLRPVIYQILSDRAKYGKVVLIYGTRTPADILFQNELAKWRSRLDFRAEVTVDRAPAAWRGSVGVVTTLIPKVSFDPQRSRRHGLWAGSDDAICGARIGRPRGGERTGLYLDGTEHEMRGRLLRPLPVGSGIHLQTGPSFSVRSNCAAAGDTRALT